MVIPESEYLDSTLSKGSFAVFLEKHSKKETNNESYSHE